MNEKYWVAFASIETIGAGFIKKVYDYCCGDIERAWKISLSELKEIEDLRRTYVDTFCQMRNKIEPEKLLEEVESSQIKLMCFDNDDYPEYLKNIHNPPMVLFYRGDFSRINLARTFAVVGSRNISLGAKDNLKNILKGFTNSDLTIVSGGAIGADTCAHMCALEYNMPTVSVLGSGLNNLYPKQNKEMFQKIIDEAGVVMTEFVPSSPPINWHFPMRNRIISGLSHGVLIAEASIKSGALITANIAIEQGREVMCMPGAISNPNTEGIYKLVKQGIPIVTNSQDILDVMEWKLKLEKPSKSTQAVELQGTEKEIYDIISKDSLTIDEIFNTLTNKSVSFSDLMILLTTLEVRGFIHTVEGNRYKVK